MKINRWLLRLSLIWPSVLGSLLLLTCVETSSAMAQMGPPGWAGSTLRGRYHYFSGPHVSFGHGRWGGGISNNGALVLNTLTTTAGAVAPSILPIFFPAAGLVGSGVTQPGPDDGSASTNLSESTRAPEPVDENRDARNLKLIEVEKRSIELLKRLNLADSEALSVGSRTPTKATIQPNDWITPGRAPSGGR